MPAAKKKQEKTFEQAMTRLDEIAAKLDCDLPLDEALALYEEGVGLIKYANKMISDAETKIRTLDPNAPPDGTDSEEAVPAEEPADV